MMKRGSGLALFLGLVAGGGNAEAGLIKLATYEFSASGGSAPEVDPRVELLLQLPSTFPPSSSGGLGDGLGLFWQDGQTGVHELTPANEATFLDFKATAQNGVVDLFTLWALFPSGGGSGHTGTEFELFGHLPDLRDFSLEAVRLIITTVDIQSYTPDPIYLPDLNGYRYRIEGRYEFLGKAIPEPSSLLLLSCLLALFGFKRDPDKNSRKHLRQCLNASIIMWCFLQFTSSVCGECTAGGIIREDAFEGGKTNQHPFLDQCAARPGTDVAIVIEAMADLGCNDWDRFYDLTGACPSSCGGDCCDVDPTLKYVTATANSVPLNSSIPGSQDMPASGRFFAEFQDNDLDPTDGGARKAGRSPCDSDGDGPFSTNLHQVKVPANVWNSWLGQVGGTVTIRLTASAAVHTAPLPERSLALYCENLGFDGCGSFCNGLCAPTTYTRVQVAFQGVDCVSTEDCDDGVSCTTDECVSYQCINTPVNAVCDDDVACNGSETCDPGQGCLPGTSPCSEPTPNCDETMDACVVCTTSAHCDDSNPCTVDRCIGNTCVNASAGSRVYVDDDGLATGDGQSWGAAMPFLQDALALAATCPATVNEIWVANGTYHPDRTEAGGESHDRYATFTLRSGLALYGGFAGTESDLTERDLGGNPSVLSGEIDEGEESNSSYHVVTSASLNLAAVLDGFTITGGRANGLTQPLNPAIGGQGMLIHNTRATVRNCRFVDNRANTTSGLGGAVVVYSNHQNAPADAVFENCLFFDNFSERRGGAIYLRLDGTGTSNSSLTNCVFVKNQTNATGIIGQDDPKTGGAIQLDSLGSYTANWTITNSIFWDNVVPGATNDGSEQIGYISPAPAHNPPTVRYTLWQDYTGTFGTAIINADPLFVNQSSGDLRLQSGSPCIDAGDSDALPAGVTNDLGGAIRFIDDPATADTGVQGARPAVVDMGPFEYPGCPSGTLEAIEDLPSGLIDARQPHPVDNSARTSRQGLGSENSYSGGPELIAVTLGASGAANLACWSLCETGIEPVESPTEPLDANFISSVVETTPGTYELTLDRPISAGHWTAIIYSGDGSRVTYASLPGDVNASEQTNVQDITLLIDYLNAIWTPPFGSYSTDLDHSQQTSVLDIGTLIDLLNGAETFVPWSGVGLPDNTCLGGMQMAQAGGGSLREGWAGGDYQALERSLLGYLAGAPFGEATFDGDIVDRLAGLALAVLSGEEVERLAEALASPGVEVGCPEAEAARQRAIELLGGQE